MAFLLTLVLIKGNLNKKYLYMKTNPYIAISDFTSNKQVEKMLAVFNSKVPPSCDYLLHIAVMMSYKTLHDKPTKWNKAYPHKESIAEIFSSDEVFNCLHYVDYENKDGLAESLESAILYGGKKLDAIQLDMIWPNPIVIREVFEKKNLSVILQIGKNAFEDVNNNVDIILERISNYGNTIQYVLLDKSMGNGVGMDAKSFLPVIERIEGKFPNLGIAVAGGLGPNTMHLAKDIFENHECISMDAQSKLRISGNSLDPLDLFLAEGYLTKGINMACKEKATL